MLVLIVLYSLLSLLVVGGGVRGDVGNGGVDVSAFYGGVGVDPVDKMVGVCVVQITFFHNGIGGVPVDESVGVGVGVVVVEVTTFHNGIGACWCSC